MGSAKRRSTNPLPTISALGIKARSTDIQDGVWRRNFIAGWAGAVYVLRHKSPGGRKL